MPFCVVKGCPSNGKGHDPNTTLHVFPKDLHLIKRWLAQMPENRGDIDEFAQKIKEGKQNETFRVCSKHFTPENYYETSTGNKRLLKTALPTLFTEDSKEGNFPSPQIRPYKKRCLRKATNCPTCGHVLEPPVKVDVGIQTDDQYSGPKSMSRHFKKFYNNHTIQCSLLFEPSKSNETDDALDSNTFHEGNFVAGVLSKPCIIKTEVDSPCVVKTETFEPCIVGTQLVERCFVKTEIVEPCINGTRLIEPCIVKTEMVEPCVVGTQLVEPCVVKSE